MKIERTIGLIAGSLLLLFTGTLRLHGNLLESSIAGALLTGKSETTEEIETVAEVSAGAEISVPELMAQIRQNPARLDPLPAERIDTETLWLARAIYSETKRPEEMELVAWVVRNRVETQYRGRKSYRDAVLDPYQFSAFNPESRNRRFYLSLTPQSPSRNWKRALTIAYGVQRAPSDDRPFPLKTRHFYSEQSMVGRSHPDWAAGLIPVMPDGRSFQLDARRFRFFSGVY
jgi:hypothetical protein